MIKFQANPEAIPFFIAAAISAALAVWTWRRRGQAQYANFGVIMAGEASWAFFEALELVTTELPVKQVCFELRTGGTAVTILAVLAIVLRFSGCANWLRFSHFGLISTPVVFFVLCAWTNRWHHLFWKELRNEVMGRHLIAMPYYGPLFWAHLAYCYLLVALTAALLAHAVFRMRGLYRAQAAVMLVGVSLPWVVNMIDMSHLFGFIHVDTAAMTFAVTGLVFLPGLFRFRLLDLTPVAWAVVVKGMNDPVVVIDLEGRVVELNAAAAVLAGRRPEVLLGTSAATAYAHWTPLAVKLKDIATASESGFELDGAGPAGESAYDAKISRLGDCSAPSGWVLVLRDITEHKRASEERVRMLREQAARAHAEAANRAKDQFLATVSHELRTPLTPVLATVTALVDDPHTPESLQPVLEMIRRNVALEARLIDDLLDLARIGRGALQLKREVTDAHQLIHHVIEICRNDLARGGLELIVDLSASRHHVDADPIRFQQVLWNLLKNAIKFTPAGGMITVRSSNKVEGAHDRTGDFDIEAPSPPILIEVIDTGIGIEPGVVARIFDILEDGSVSMPRRFGGLGLGLTISRSIVEQHGGQLSAASAGIGQGAAFTVGIPSVTSPSLSSAREEPPSPAGDAPVGLTDKSPIRILLVDDNVDTLKALTRLLAARGLDVVPADSKALALELATDAEFDILVSDIELHDGSGLELMSRLRDSRPLPGIAFSGFGAPEDVEQSLAAGFVLHLVKPIDFRLLEQSIRDVAASAPAESLVKG
jgi:signal transduction histidine kinase/ActR/RegA family two-component response regulator